MTLKARAKERRKARGVRLAVKSDTAEIFVRARRVLDDRQNPIGFDGLLKELILFGERP